VGAGGLLGRPPSVNWLRKYAQPAARNNAARATTRRENIAASVHGVRVIGILASRGSIWRIDTTLKALAYDSADACRRFC
jgi:hypothetical protein